MSIKSLMKIGSFLSEHGLDGALDDGNVGPLLDGIGRLLSLKNVRLVDVTGEALFKLAAGNMDRGACDAVAEALRAFASGSELKLSELVSSGQWINFVSGRSVKEAALDNKIVTWRCKSCGELNFS